jgi:NhaP-type Na+/H+ and K+/H+ antiporter
MGAPRSIHLVLFTWAEVTMRFGAALLVVWLIIGAIAAGQRGYYNSSHTNCAKASTVFVTIVAGPLNYVGANPKVSCELPQPSQ